MLVAVLVVLALTILIGGLVLGSAGTWDLPMVWVYLVVFALVSMLGNVTIHRSNPDLLKQRLKVGRSDIPDRLFRGVLGIGFLSHYVIAGLDIGRFHWSGQFPLFIQILGLIGFAGGSGIGLWAAVVNPFFTTEVRIQGDRDHQVITAGPYQLVRHPGYASGILFLSCSGLALGSWWSLLPILLIDIMLIRRTALEDQLLQRELNGYAGYARKVRFRIVPGLW